MEFCGMKREIDRKCLNHARVHANAQSFDRCEGQRLRPEVAILGADQKERGLWGRECRTVGLVGGSSAGRWRENFDSSNKFLINVKSITER